MKRKHLIYLIAAVSVLVYAGMVSAQESLPFPEPPSASVAGKTLKNSKHQWRKAESHLPKDAPNIVIFMTDDAGFANPRTFGGPIRTPTLDRLGAEGLRARHAETVMPSRTLPAHTSMISGAPPRVHGVGWNR